MKRPKTLVVAIILLVILLSVEVVVVKRASDYEPKIKAIYAKVKIPAETVITKDMLIEKEVALSLVNMKAIKDTAEAVGKIAKFDIEEMEMITNSRIAEKIEEKAIELLDKNNRLITVKFEPDQVNGWWLNDRVDIIFIPDRTLTVAQKASNNIDNTAVGEEPKTITYNSAGIVRLENIRVAGIIDENRLLVDKIENTTYRPVLVSFEVNTEQDKFLAWAKYNGKLEVSARKALE